MCHEYWQSKTALEGSVSHGKVGSDARAALPMVPLLAVVQQPRRGSPQQLLHFIPPSDQSTPDLCTEPQTQHPANGVPRV